MLTLDLSGQRYNKSEHRRRLATVLNDRSEASIELKHRNISAVLLLLGCPTIPGYKALPHFQHLLFDVVAEHVDSNAIFDSAALHAVDQPAVSPIVLDFERVLVKPPKSTPLGDSMAPIYSPKFHAFRRDYLAREAKNRSLGEAGELFAVEFESRRLHGRGKRQLSERVERVSASRGDGLGYDILSFDESGKEKFIEVRTTAFAKETPFFISRNEIAFSEKESEKFHLYRLFEFRKVPRLFDLRGPVAAHCLLDPVTCIARFS
jgi:hypothetical protein